jgi:hypothetical protein
MTGEFWAEIPGQPPTWNSSYRIVHARARDQYGAPVFREDGQPKTYSTLKKQDVVVAYQQAATYVIRTAKPSGFHPEGFLYVVYDLFLKRDIDADNVMKALNDTLAGCLDIDDKMFLPVVRTKVTGVKDPHVRLGVFDASLWKVQIEKL